MNLKMKLARKDILLAHFGIQFCSKNGKAEVLDQNLPLYELKRNNE